jgi:hypothetical protein
MINLCIPIEYDSDNFTIYDVPVILENIDEFIIPIVAEKYRLPLTRVSVRLCKWFEYKDDTYLSFNLLINLNDITEYSVRVNEGGYCSTNKRIIEFDGFVDIKTDSTSVNQAILDIRQKRIPLWNRVDKMNYEAFPYVVKDKDDDDQY